ncbi:unnamed protein product [Prorocentrum cordatum]|uniref:Protein kinase domain-containing protein n=1 Tax=Prorocentrum cordatum TaxID=2364126 RepID=A0ABN9V2P1_9DINO|nr:unnamed protein product [Polarella glacialis]
MAARPQTKLSQAEMLERLTAAPFKQTRAVPKDRATGSMRSRRPWPGTRAFEGERAARPLHSSTAAGCGTSAHYQDREESKLIVGYIEEEAAAQTVAESQEYVKTSRANRLGEGRWVGYPSSQPLSGSPEEGTNELQGLAAWVHGAASVVGFRTGGFLLCADKVTADQCVKVFETLGLLCALLLTVGVNIFVGLIGRIIFRGPIIFFAVGLGLLCGEIVLYFRSSSSQAAVEQRLAPAPALEGLRARPEAYVALGQVVERGRAAARAAAQSSSCDGCLEAVIDGSAAVERAALLEALAALAARTELGAVERARVVASEAAGGPGKPGAAALGRGRFASVVGATVMDAADGAGAVQVAAKRFAARARAVDGGEVPFVPLSALRSARREARALLAVLGHANVVELLGVVAPLAAAAAPSPVGSLDGEMQASPPLQLLLRRSDGSLSGLLGSGADWEGLGRPGRLSLLRDAARGLAALHEALGRRTRRRRSGRGPARARRVGCPHLRPGLRGGGRRGHAAVAARGHLGVDRPGGRRRRHGDLPDLRMADVFSFGVVIWEAVAGPGAQNPLQGLAGEAYCEAVAAGRRPPFAAGAAGTEEAMLAEECWQLDSSSRPAMAEVVGRLEAMMGPADPDAALKHDPSAISPRSGAHAKLKL